MSYWDDPHNLKKFLKHYERPITEAEAEKINKLIKAEPECNGICLYAADLGPPEYGDVVAYAHPDCPEHGDPTEEDPDAEVCGDGDETLRYVREEDLGCPPGCTSPFCSCPGND